eukprot:662453-Amphidinium_carterae.1
MEDPAVALKALVTGSVAKLLAAIQESDANAAKFCRDKMETLRTGTRCIKWFDGALRFLHTLIVSLVCRQRLGVWCVRQ